MLLGERGLSVLPSLKVTGPNNGRKDLVFPRLERRGAKRSEKVLQSSARADSECGTEDDVTGVVVPVHGEASGKEVRDAPKSQKRLRNPV